MGRNWKKSPKKITCFPPNRREDSHGGDHGSPPCTEATKTMLLLQQLVNYETVTSLRLRAFWKLIVLNICLR